MVGKRHEGKGGAQVKSNEQASKEKDNLMSNP